MFHEDISTVNILKRNYWLVICIAKNLIWTALKKIFRIIWIFLHPHIPDLQILSNHNKPYIINLIFFNCTFMTGFVL